MLKTGQLFRVLPVLPRERVRKRIFIIITIIWTLGKRERGMDREKEREGVEKRKEGGMKGRRLSNSNQWEKG